MKNFLLYFLLFIAMFLWGASWPSSKILTTYTSADIIAFWRFFFVSLGGILPLIYLKISFKIDKKILKWIIFAGIFNATYSWILFQALLYGSAGKGGVLNTTMIPVFSYILFIFILIYKKEKLSEKVSKSEIFGLILGLISGLCLLNLNSLNELFGRFNMLFLLCALLWAVMTIFTQKTKGMHPLAVNFYINLTSLLCFMPLLFFPQSFAVFDYDLKFWWNLFVVAILSTLVGTSIYYYGIYKLGGVKANSFILITPASALFCSFLVLDEVPSLLTLIGCVFAIFAIYFINIYKKKDKVKS